MKKNLEKEQAIFEVLSNIYIFIILLVFPLIVDSTGFFHILECKWYSFLIIATTYIVSIVLTYIYYLIFKKVNYLKSIKFSKIQCIAVAFLVVNIISCFLSPFFKNYNLFVGVGRGEGLIMMSLYIISFLFISLFARFQKKHILYFSISSILLNTIAIAQYIGFNPFNMYQDGIGTHNVSFIGTIGNVDFVSATYCILLSVSCSAFIFLDERRRYKIIHLLSVLMGFFILGIIDVQSGKFGFLSIIAIVIPFIISNNKRFSRFLILIATFLMSYCINVFINPEYHYDIGKLNLYFQFNYLVLLFLIVIILLIFLSKKIYKIDYDFTSDKKVISRIYLGMLICVGVGIIGLYFYNFKSGFLYEIHELLHGNFDDEFGTYRIFLWKRTLKIAPEYLILGSGPDSFAIRFMAKYTNDIAQLGELTLNDTAANVYLTMLINLGLVGLFNYLLLLISQIRNGIKEMNQYSRILLISIICYIIQDFFNLSVVIVSPLFWVLMGLHYRSLLDKNID